MTDRELIEWIKEQIAQYRIDVRKPAQSPNLAEWTLLGIENAIRIAEEKGNENVSK